MGGLDGALNDQAEAGIMKESLKGRMTNEHWDLTGRWQQMAVFPCFFLLNGSFFFPLSSNACSKGVLQLFGLLVFYCMDFTLQYKVPLGTLLKKNWMNFEPTDWFRAQKRKWLEYWEGGNYLKNGVGNTQENQADEWIQIFFIEHVCKLDLCSSLCYQRSKTVIPQPTCTMLCSLKCSFTWNKEALIKF